MGGDANYLFSLSTILGPQPKQAMISGYVDLDMPEELSNLSIRASYVGPEDIHLNGNYFEFTVPAGWEGEITPIIPGYQFTPASFSLKDVTEDQMLDTFSGQLTDTDDPVIQGTVLDMLTREPRALQSVILLGPEGDILDTQLTDENGFYQFSIARGQAVTMAAPGLSLSIGETYQAWMNNVLAPLNCNIEVLPNSQTASLGCSILESAGN